MLKDSDTIYETILKNGKKVLIYGTSFSNALKNAGLEQNETAYYTNPDCFSNEYKQKQAECIRRQERKLGLIGLLIRKARNQNIVFDPVEEGLNEYWDAYDAKDEEKMKVALIKYAQSCPNCNSNCLSEVFCPSCPFGGGVVLSGRSQ